MIVLDNEKEKIVSSKKYNFKFNKQTGYFVRWGKNLDDDPDIAPSGEILDLEITDICTGINGVVCPFCYKANLPTNKQNMSFETFKTIFDKIYKTKILTQIAFGADSHATSNPDLWKMMEYAREKGVIPNITVAQIDEDTADKLAKYCGAVAVSVYDNKDVAYDSVKLLTDRGMKQVNIHRLIEKKSYLKTIELLNDIKNDSRLSKLNAVVFLSLKQKGRGIHFERIDDVQFMGLVKLALEKQISFGFDSCSAPKFVKAIKMLGCYDKYIDMTEPCESSLFSMYINVKGEFYPCSFTEGTEGWEKGIDVVNCNDFIKDVWQNPRLNEFRNKLLNHKDCNNCRQCPIYNI